MKKKSVFIVILVLALSIGVFTGIKLVDKRVSDEISLETINKAEVIETVKEELPPEPVYVDIDILAVGDIMFHMPQIRSSYIGNGEYDFAPMFEYVKGYIEDVDLSFGNYETVTLDTKEYSGFPRFNSPIETVKALKETGFDILSTANNHSLDQGKPGVISTIEAIKSYGLASVGTSMDKDKEPLVVDIDGITIGILSYTYGLNGMDGLLSSEDRSYMINLIDEEKIYDDINKMGEMDIDMLISYIHWGYEYHLNPSKYQIELGQKMVDWGVNIVLGSHPHVVQGSQIIEKDGRDNLIVYSMGNFISNQRESTMGNPNTEDGVMVKINIEKNLTTKETLIKEIEYIPTWVYKYSREGKTHYRVLPTEEILKNNLNIDLNQNTLNRIKKSNEFIREVYQRP